MRKTITFVALLIALVAVSSASAGKVKHITVHPIGGFLCTDNGTTLYFDNIAAALHRFPDATPGKCQVEPPVVIPPTDTVVEPPIVVIPEDHTPSAVFLCYSHILGSTPGMVEYDLIQTRVDQGWFAPIVVSQAEATKQHISTDKWASPDGVHVLVCNPDGLKATGTGLNGSEGDFLDTEAWKTTLLQSQYDPQHRNTYEFFA